jgi:hypothetical protein
MKYLLVYLTLASMILSIYSGNLYLTFPIALFPYYKPTTQHYKNPDNIVHNLSTYLQKIFPKGFQSLRDIILEKRTKENPEAVTQEPVIVVILVKRKLINLASDTYIVQRAIIDSCKKDLGCYNMNIEIVNEERVCQNGFSYIKDIDMGQKMLCCESK